MYLNLHDCFFKDSHRKLMRDILEKCFVKIELLTEREHSNLLFRELTSDQRKTRNSSGLCISIKFSHVKPWSTVVLC